MSAEKHVRVIESVLDEILSHLDGLESDDIQEYVPPQRRQAKYDAAEARNVEWRKRIGIALDALGREIEDCHETIRGDG